MGKGRAQVGAAATIADGLTSLLPAARSAIVAAYPPPTTIKSPPA